MSVMVIKKEVYGEIADFLISRELYQKEGSFFRGLTFEERRELEYWAIKTKKSSIPDESVKNAIGCFVDRLYIANQMANYYMYEVFTETDSKEIDRLEMEDICYDGMDIRRFLKEIESVQYNIHTNGGTTFLGKKDSEKLEWLISMAKTEVIGKSEGKVE